MSSSIRLEPQVKTVGIDGQISLGKQFAGCQVLVEEQEPGVWLIRTAKVVPDNERWLQHPQTLADLKSALGWSSAHPPCESQVEDLRDSQ